MIPLLFVILVTVATVLLGIIATKRAQSASDFFVAGRQVSVFMNASAISGEYLSAASFMGVAGLVMRFGYDAMWYPEVLVNGRLLRGRFEFTEKGLMDYSIQPVDTL